MVSRRLGERPSYPFLSFLTVRGHFSVKLTYDITSLLLTLVFINKRPIKIKFKKKTRPEAGQHFHIPSASYDWAIKTTGINGKNTERSRIKCRIVHFRPCPTLGSVSSGNFL